MIDQSLLNIGSFRVIFGASTELRILATNAVGVSFPSVSLAGITRPFRNNQGYVPSETLTYDALSVRFAIDETMALYDELFEWMRRNTNESPGLITNDIMLQFLTSHNNVAREVQFHAAFPTSLGGLELSVQSSEVEYAYFNASFLFDKFEFVR